MPDYVWDTFDPLGNRVVLREDTYENHVIDPGNRTEKDIEGRKQIDAKAVVEQPRFIYCDSSSGTAGRARYIDLQVVDEKLRAVVVIAETDRDPREVVTYMFKEKLKGEDLRREAIIYDSKNPKGQLR